MNERSVAERVELFLAQEGMEREDVRVYMTGLRESFENLNRKIDRSFLSVILACAIFVLLSHGNLTEAEIFNVKVQDFSMFRLLIPVFVSLAIARAISISIAMMYLEELYSELLRQWMPKWHEAELGMVPMSAGGFFIYVIPGLLDEQTAKWRGKDFLVQFLALVLSPILFGVYAYASIFTDDKIGVGWAVLSLLLTLGGVAVGLYQVVTDKRQDD
ncbi:hypothetical protein ACGFIG_30470 [Micromonospora sp. NPDC049048]|uniref:hypothetical protein n=1 Tax=Micromonospora sp. NPDC049048 TaxID=3364263 RepID=UPI0037180CFB